MTTGTRFWQDNYIKLGWDIFYRKIKSNLPPMWIHKSVVSDSLLGAVSALREAVYQNLKGRYQ